MFYGGLYSGFRGPLKRDEKGIPLTGEGFLGVFLVGL